MLKQSIMTDMNISLTSGFGEDPCAFRVQMKPVLDLTDGRWFVAVASIDINFIYSHPPDNVFIMSSIVDYSYFGSEQRQVLRSLGNGLSTAFDEEELVYIKTRNGIYNDIGIRLVGDKGYSLGTKSVNAQTTIQLRLFNLDEQ